MGTGRPRVVIVGAGFGGLVCAKKLQFQPVDVLLVDRHNYHLFTPLLYQVASSLLNASDIAFPVRKVFRASPNVTFRTADVTRADLGRRVIVAADGEEIAYDYLVVAGGSTTHYFGNERIARRALGLKTLSEALQLRNHILSCLEVAARIDDPDQQQALITFVIAGGGPTGVEYAGALAELMRLVLRKEYPTITASPRILLVEGQGRLLSMFSERLSAYTAKRLTRLGVEVRLDTLVKSASDEGIELSDGSFIRSATLVWSAGVRPAAIAADLEVDLTRRTRRIAVDEHLRMGGRTDAFAIGDIAGFEQGGAELPMLSAPAMQEGRHVAAYILAHLADRPGEPPKIAPYRYRDKGTMATIGRNHAVASVGGVETTGVLAWLLWLVVHIYYLIGFRNRLVVLWGWFWNYVWYDRPVRIIAEPKGPPKVPDLPALSNRARP